VSIRNRRLAKTVFHLMGRGFPEKAVGALPVQTSPFLDRFVRWFHDPRSNGSSREWRSSRPSQRQWISGFTLIELLIVLVLIGLLVSLALPSSNPSVYEQLRAVGQIVNTDLAYARSLAISHGSTYRVRFETANNRYVLQHTGSDPTLNVLPNSPWRNPDDPPDQHIVRLDELPQVGIPVRLAAIRPSSSSDGGTGDVEFGPLGGITNSTAVVIWLSAGQGQIQRFLSITVDPITGLASLGTVTGEGPSP